MMRQNLRIKLGKRQPTAAPEVEEVGEEAEDAEDSEVEVEGVEEGSRWGHGLNRRKGQDQGTKDDV